MRRNLLLAAPLVSVIEVRSGAIALGIALIAVAGWSVLRDPARIAFAQRVTIVGGGMVGSNYTDALRTAGLTTPGQLIKQWDVTFGIGGTIGLGTVWMRHQNAQLARSNRALEARIAEVRRGITETIALVESEQMLARAQSIAHVGSWTYDVA